MRDVLVLYYFYCFAIVIIVVVIIITVIIIIIKQHNRWSIKTVSPYAIRSVLIVMDPTTSTKH